MALAHGGIYGQSFLDCSTPSVSSTSMPFTSHQDGAMKHKYSSPIAECYAYDHDQDAPSFCYDGLQKPLSPPKSDISQKYPKREEDARFSSSFPRPWSAGKASLRSEKGLSYHLKNLHSDQETEARRISANLHKVLFNGSNQVKANGAQISHGSVKERPTTTQLYTKKPLLSPITFTPQTATSDASDSTLESSYSLCSQDGPASQPLMKISDCNRCDFPPKEVFNQEDNESMTERQFPYAQPRMKNSNRRRSVSLGEGLRSQLCSGNQRDAKASNIFPNPRSMITRTKGLRRSAGSFYMKRRPWVENPVESTQHVGSCKSDGTGDGNEEVPSKPRLWIDATRSEEKIEEAVCGLWPWRKPLLTRKQHLTTVTQSPTKPKVINISRRDSVVTPPKPLSAEHQSQLDSGWKHGTPPNTLQESVGLGLSAEKAQSHKKSLLHDRLQDYPYTPPTSRISTPRAQSTVRRALPVSPASGTCEAALLGPPFNDSSDRIERVVGQLEAALNNYPTARLYLDSPIIQSICVLDEASASSAQALCRTPLVSAPHSRYSMLRPLSSHSLTPQSAPTYRGVQYRGNTVDSRVNPSQPSAMCPPPCFPAARDNATSTALRIIFPQAPAALLDSLQATYIALNYISSCRFASPTPISKHPSTPSPTSSLRSVSSIPAKALATLGIVTPGRTSTAGSSCLRPASPDHDPVAVYRKEARKLKERSEDLQVNLRLLVRGLLGEIEGRRLGKKDESLVRAVGEVVRCGEKASKGLLDG
ncbi:MAG: hypothetical protein Q9191_008005 [Dirinaria sp. TL-2023a]